MFFFLCGYLPFYFKHPANFSSSSIASFALLLSRVGWGKISMVGQSESDIFVPELKAKELTIAGSSVLPSLFQWENKNVDLITIDGFSHFSKQIKITLPHHTHFALPYPKLSRVSLIWFKGAGWSAALSLLRPGELANIACQTLLFVSVSLAMDNQRTLLFGREQ